MMLRLKTFGGLAVDRDGTGAPTASQRRRLALLAILAAAGDRGVSRDRVLALLWPESPAERARHSLGQLVYGLRRELGAADLVLGAGELRLDPAVVACDLWEFDAALRAGEAERAVAAYAGPFLDGFHLTDAPEFERWADAERGRLALRHAEALESLARATAGRGELASAVAWWRRLAAVDPLSSRVARELMCALDAAGDRAAALRHATVHEALVRQELESEVDPTVAALADALRAGTAVRPPAAGAPPVASLHPSGPVASVRDAAPDGSAPAPIGRMPDVLRASEEHRPGTPSRRRVRIGFAVGALLLGAVVAMVALPAARQQAAPTPVSPTVVAVLPFAVSGGEQVAYLREGLVSLLGTKLDGAGRIRSVDPHAVLRATASGAGAHQTFAPAEARALAERLGAGMYVLGAVVGAGHRVEITATLYDVRQDGHAVARASVEGDVDSLFRHVDELTAGLLASANAGPAGQLARTAALTTRSLPALKRYLVGEQLYREGRFGAAREAFQEAVAHDSTFALAYVRLGLTEGWLRRPDRVEHALERAAASAARLPERTQLLLRAIRSRDADGAERLFRGYVDRYPDDVQGWYGLGELLFHQNGPRGRSGAEARAPFERAVALAPQEMGEALQHLAQLAAAEGRREALDSLVRRYLTVHPAGEWTLAMRAMRAAGGGDTAEERAVARALRTQRSEVVRLAAEFSALTGNLAAAGRLAGPLLDAARSREDRALGRMLIAQMEAGQGRWSAASASLVLAESLDARSALASRAELAALLFVPLPASELERLRRALVDAGELGAESERDDAALLAALLAARLGDDGEALAYATRAERDAGSANGRAAARWRAAEVRAFVALLRGRAAEGLAQLDAAGGAYGPLRLRLLRAELLYESGRPADALPWYGAALEGYGAAPLLAHVALRQAQAHERLGRRAEAARHYARFTSLWRACDAVSRSAVAEANRRLTWLASVQ